MNKVLRVHYCVDHLVVNWQSSDAPGIHIQLELIEVHFLLHRWYWRQIFLADKFLVVSSLILTGSVSLHSMA